VFFFFFFFDSLNQSSFKNATSFRKQEHYYER